MEKTNMCMSVFMCVYIMKFLITSTEIIYYTTFRTDLLL
jgi:hypothetical protein